MTGLELGWFDALADGPLGLDELAQRSRLTYASALRLARAAVALRLLEWRGDDQVALGPLGAALIGDAGIAAMAAHHDLFYRDMARPLALLRDRDRPTALGDYWGYARNATPAALDEADVRDYSALMAASQPMIAEQVLAAVRLRRFRHHLDVGGGTGAFVRAVGAAYPHLRQTLFDLPAVVRQAVLPDARNVEAVGGSFLDDTLPRGADLVSLIRIIHDHDDDSVRKLLVNVRASIDPAGTLLIAEPMAGTAGGETMADAYFGFYLLAMGSGRARSQQEIDALLAAAGFSATREQPTPLPMICRVLLANPV